MAEHFWIQVEDGKFEGSLPGVPKQGNEVMNASVKTKDSVVERINKEIDMLKRSSDIYKKAVDAAFEQRDKKDRVYDRLAKAGLPTEGVDKYYHSVAHCKIARLGFTGVITSHAQGIGKEIYDILKKVFVDKHSPRYEVKESFEDLEANEIGRQVGVHGDPSKSCEELCKGQWPKNIPEEYRE